MQDSELKKYEYILLQIEEIENKILEIDDKIVEEDLTVAKNVALEFFIYLTLVSSLVVLMLVFNKYLVFLTLVILITSFIFIFYYLSCYKENRNKERLINNLITEKFNLENILETIPKKHELKKNIDLINKKRI